jgi:transcriptional regulator with XRE-family HTH domain
MTGNLTFGERLDDQLRSRGWSQAEFGDSVGVVRQTVSGWVNDLQRPRRRLLTTMARVLDLDADDVLARAGKPPVSADHRLSSRQAPRIEWKTSANLDDPFVRFMLEHSTVLTAEQRDLIMQVVLQMEKGNES